MRLFSCNVAIIIITSHRITANFSTFTNSIAFAYTPTVPPPAYITASCFVIVVAICFVVPPIIQAVVRTFSQTEVPLQSVVI